MTKAPLIMGVLNVTPDSFSDGSSYNSTAAAVDAAKKMIDDGADIIDVGGESTRPGADTVPEQVEMARILPVIDALAGQIHVPISIDTWKSGVAAAAINAGAEIVNDISGMTFDPLMLSTVAGNEAALVIMHSRGKPANMQLQTDYGDIVRDVKAFLQGRIDAAVAAGIAAEKIVVDPGIGFGKSVSGNLEILRRLDELRSLNRPVLVGTSRKSFIGTVLNRDTSDRVFGTAATVAVSMVNGAAIFRVHDIRGMRDTVDMVRAIMTG